MIFQLGTLLAPVLELTKQSPPPASAYRIAAARGIPDCERWSSQEVRRFTAFDEYHFQHLEADIVREVHNLFYELPELAKDHDDAARQATLAQKYQRCRNIALAAIDQVPIEWVARIHESRTPFSVYLRIRDAVATAKRRVHYFDRYLDRTFFDIYLRELDRALEVRLITTKGDSKYGVTNVLPLSRLVAGEFADYRLIETTAAELHDRNLRVDDHVFFLGTSAKNAGVQPTNFAPADNTPSGQAVLDQIVSAGTVIS